MSRLPPDEMHDALQAVLEDMQQTVDALVLALEAERSAVYAADNGALDRAGTRKQSLMQRLEQLDAERRQLRREIPATAPAATPAWTRIKQSLRTCQQLNQRNGSAVNQRLVQVREALSVLTGHAGERSLYGRAGELHASLRSQVLAEV